jgi:hypothetical protein
MSAKKANKNTISGEVFHPAKETIKQANVQEYEKAYQ